MNKKKLKWVLLLGSVTLLGLTGCMAGGTTNSAQEEYTTATVERQTLRSSVEGSGNLTADTESYVAFQVNGTVVEIAVETGDEVKIGDVLVALDSTDAERSVKDAGLQVELAEVSLKSAQLNLDQLLTWEPDEDAVALAEANLATAEFSYNRTLRSAGQRDDQLTSSQIRLTQAERSLADAQEAWDSAYDEGREWELGDRFRKAMLENEREMADSNLLRAQEDYEVALASFNLDLTNVGDSGVNSAWGSVVSAQVNLNRETTGPDDDDITSAEIQVSQSEISLAQAELKYSSALETLADMTLLAPIDGIVTQVNVEQGLNAISGQTAVVVADLSSMVVEIDLDESDVIQVSLGQQAIMAVDAFDSAEVQGEVSHIAPAATIQSGVVLYQVVIDIDPTPMDIRSGMTTDVEIVTASTEEALAVPLKAIRSEPDGTYVMRELHTGESVPSTQVGVPEGFVMVKVEVGIISNNLAEVVSGLEQGDVVYIAIKATEDSGLFMMGPGMGRP